LQLTRGQLTEIFLKIYYLCNLSNLLTPLKIYNHIDEFSSGNHVVTIGIFDGVHRGHVEILRRIRQLADHYGGESVVITLWPHPRLVLQPGNTELRLLTSLNEKLRLIEQHQVDKVVVLPFDHELAAISYDRFIREYLSQRIGAKHIVVGYNHHFGKDRKGTFENLQKCAHDLNILAERLDPVIIDNSRISSSGIRHMLEEGRIQAANVALGYPYFLNGTVVEGSKIGRTIGFPTANIAVDDHMKLLPRNGVYAVKAELEGKEYPGMMNIGTRPTLPHVMHDRTLEVNLFDFNRDIYDARLRIRFFDWLRCEITFGSVEELVDQIKTDRKEVLDLFRIN